jgi:Protein of unknown function (DUF1573)
MSNGLKVGLLIVIAGALGFLGFSQWKKGQDNIESRVVENTEGSLVSNNTTPSQPISKPANDAGKASEGRTKTSITFDKKEHNFGKMKQGDQVECVFKVTNTGTEPLIIEEAHGSCGCTVPDYPKEPIPGGQTRDIKVKFNSAGKKGSQSKTVTLTANTEPLQSVLTIKAEVEVPEGADTKAAGH